MEARQRGRTAHVGVYIHGNLEVLLGRQALDVVPCTEQTELFGREPAEPDGIFPVALQSVSRVTHNDTAGGHRNGTYVGRYSHFEVLQLEQ